MTTPEPNKSRPLVIGALKWLLAIGLLAGLFWLSRDNLAELKNRKILWGAFAVALGVRGLSLMATFSRWRMLVRGIGIPFSFREAFRLGMLGEGCNLMGPGAVGGDLVKAALLAKNHPSRIASVMATAFLDRVLGLWALFVLGALATLSPTGTKLGPELQWTVWALWGGAAAGLIGISLMFVPKFTHSRLMHWLTTWKFVGRIVKELMDSIELYQGKPQVVMGAAGLGLIGHFGFLSVFYFCAVALHHGQVIPGFVDHVVGLPLPEALSAAVPSPGGVGALEGAVAWLGYRLTALITGAIGVVYYLTSRGEIGKAVHDIHEE